MKKAIATATTVIMTVASLAMPVVASDGEGMAVVKQKDFVADGAVSYGEKNHDVPEASAEQSDNVYLFEAQTRWYTAEHESNTNEIKVYTKEYRWYVDNGTDIPDGEVNAGNGETTSVTLQVKTEAGVKNVTVNSYPQECLEVIAQVNAQRKKAGLPELTVDQALVDAALQRVAETTVKWSHTRPDGASWMTVCEGVNGENIAMGQKDASAVMTSWMNSEGHKENILRGEFTRIGVGCVEVNGDKYWVQLFGR